MDSIFRVLAGLFFLFLNAVFVLAEFAIVSVRRTKIEELAQNDNILAKSLLDILDNIKAYLAAIQLGITAASIGLGWVAQPYVASLINELIPSISISKLGISSYSISLAISFCFVTFIHIVFGEQVPKYIAISSSQKVALFFALPLKIFYKITYYPMLFINRISDFFTSLLKMKDLKDDTSHSEDEIRLILSKSEEVGKISLQRLMMFEHLFDFGRTTVKEVMTPIEKVVFLKTSSNFDDIIYILRERKFSRYPVLDEKDNFIGYVHIKDIIFDGFCKCDDFKLVKYIRTLPRVKETELIESVLRKIQENHQPIMLVENERGEPRGIITDEDILEDLTGELRDEFEKKPPLRLDEIFALEASTVDLKANDRFSAISELIDNLYNLRVISIKDEIKNKVINRERELSTAIGYQIAVPHARIEGLKKSVVCVGISRSGIDFNSPDGKPIKLIFLILTPYHEPSSQLNILSKISKLSSNLTLRKKLFNAKTTSEIKEIFTIFEDSIPN